MQTLGNICGTLFVLGALTGLYVAAAAMLGFMGGFEPQPPGQELLVVERLIFALPGLPLLVRRGLLSIGPLLVVLIGTVFFFEAMFRFGDDLVETKPAKAKGSAR